MSVETRNQLAVALHYDRTGAPRVIAKGKGKMPGYDGKISKDDITAVTKYIRTLKK